MKAPSLPFKSYGQCKSFCGQTNGQCGQTDRPKKQYAPSLSERGHKKLLTSNIKVWRFDKRVFLASL